MRYWHFAAAALVALESAALACSCIATDDPSELKRFAVEASEGAVALVEAQVVSAYDPATGAGELMRVVRTLAGTAPAQFQVQRAGPPSSAACDVEYRAGEQALVILYPAPAANDGGVPTYRTSGLCTVHLLDKPVYRDALIDRIGVSISGERG